MIPKVGERWRIKRAYTNRFTENYVYVVTSLDPTNNLINYHFEDEPTKPRYGNMQAFVGMLEPIDTEGAP